MVVFKQSVFFHRFSLVFRGVPWADIFQASITMVKNSSPIRHWAEIFQAIIIMVKNSSPIRPWLEPCSEGLPKGLQPRPWLEPFPEGLPINSPPRIEQLAKTFCTKHQMCKMSRLRNQFLLTYGWRIELLAKTSCKSGVFAGCLGYLLNSGWQTELLAKTSCKSGVFAKCLC